MQMWGLDNSVTLIRNWHIARYRGEKEEIYMHTSQEYGKGCPALRTGEKGGATSKTRANQIQTAEKEETQAPVVSITTPSQGSEDDSRQRPKLTILEYLIMEVVHR